MAVIETGLGGRLDATNVLTPTVTMITDISIDHAEILGPTLTDIAGEKAGIIKPGVPVVAGMLPAEARRVIRSVCRERKAPYIPLKRTEFSLNQHGLRSNLDGLRFDRLAPSLPGPHQLKNCALVLKAVGELRRGGFRIRKAEIKRGLETVRWPGRFQIVRHSTGLPTVVLDVCHNAGGAAAFADTFRTTFPGRKAQIVVGFVKRKEHQELIDSLAKITDRFWLVPLASKRSVDVIEIEKNIDWHGVPVTRLAGLQSAHKKLLKLVGADDIVAVIGSHFLVGEYLGKYGDG